LGFLISVLIEAWAEMEQSVSRFELSVALWEALAETLLAEWHRKRYEKNMPECFRIDHGADKEQQEKAKRIQQMVLELSDHSRANKSETVKEHSQSVTENRTKVSADDHLGR
jgi:hypothetical protein